MTAALQGDLPTQALIAALVLSTMQKAQEKEGEARGRKVKRRSRSNQQTHRHTKVDM
jgi:hypothetical protein